MPTTIENFLRINLDFVESGGVTQEYAIVNDLSHNNILNIYCFLTTKVLNQSITLNVKEYDITNVLQNTETYYITSGERILKKVLNLTTVNTIIDIFSPTFNGVLTGTFEKTQDNTIGLGALDVSGQVVNITANTVNVYADVSGQRVDISGQTVVVSGGIDISGQTVIVSGGIDISGQRVDISGQTIIVSGGIDISGQTVIVSGGIDISGQRVDISGQTIIVSGGIDISGQTVIVSGGIDISGQRVDISGQTIIVSGGIDISGQRVDISGQRIVTDISGQRVDISGQRVNISGQTVVISGGIDISGQRVDISGQRVVTDISGQRVDISGQILRTITAINQLGSFGNIMSNGSLAATSGVTSTFNCTGYTNNSVITYQDASGSNTGSILVFASPTNSNFSQIGLLQPIVNIESKRTAHAIFRMAAFNYVYLKNNSATANGTVFCSIYSS
jgi:hypothetical protein